VLRGNVAVISPHLDDAAFSLGATIARISRAGASVRIVTVLAGDARAAFPAGAWDRSSGFDTAGHAAHARAAEDDEASAILGARAVRLPYFDKQYSRGGDDAEIRAAILGAVAGCDVLLAPGFPLTHEDHEWLARLLIGDLESGRRVGLYVEQPYTARMKATPKALFNESGPWEVLPGGPADQFAKLRACRAYKSQIEPLGGLRVLMAVLRYEAQRGGESISWIDDS